MKKIKKSIVAVMLGISIIGGSILNVSANATTPFTSAYTTISTTGATSTITKCSCSSVNNYLMAGIMAQYKSGNNYYWIPSSTSYYYNEGYNIAKASKTISHINITYAKGWFQARCGSGATKSFYRYDNK